MQAAGPRVRQPWPTSRMLTITVVHLLTISVLLLSKTDGAGLHSPTYAFKASALKTHRTSRDTESVHVVKGRTGNNPAEKINSIDHYAVLDRSIQQGSLSVCG